MVRRAARDPRLEAIGERLARQLGAELDAAGYPIDWQVYGRLLAADGPMIRALEREALTRSQARYASRDEQRVASAREADAVSYEDLQALWDLSQAEMRAARDLGLLHTIEPPPTLREAFSTPHYYRAMPLGEDQRRQIAAVTLLSRLDAAVRLGITPATFGRLRRVHGVAHADRAPTAAGHSMLLFRQTDVDRLGEHLATATQPGQGATERAP